MYSEKVEKAIRDVTNNAIQSASMCDKIISLRVGDITEEDFWIAYNIFRVKRGEIMNED